MLVDGDTMRRAMTRVGRLKAAPCICHGYVLLSESDTSVAAPSDTFFVTTHKSPKHIYGLSDAAWPQRWWLTSLRCNVHDTQLKLDVSHGMFNNGKRASFVRRESMQQAPQNSKQLIPTVAFLEEIFYKVRTNVSFSIVRFDLGLQY